MEALGERGSVVGDLNDWTPGVHTLVKRRNGTRSVKVPVERGGSYRFRYLAEGGVWFDDPAVQVPGWNHGDGQPPPQGMREQANRRGVPVGVVR